MYTLSVHTRGDNSRIATLDPHFPGHGRGHTRSAAASGLELAAYSLGMRHNLPAASTHVYCCQSNKHYSVTHHSRSVKLDRPPTP